MACDPVPIIPSLGCCATSASSAISIQGNWAGSTSLIGDTVYGVRFLRRRQIRTYIPYNAYSGGTGTVIEDHPKWIADNSNGIITSSSTGDYDNFLSPGNWLVPASLDASNASNIATDIYKKTALRSRFTGEGIFVNCGYLEEWLENEWTLDSAMAELMQLIDNLSNWPAALREQTNTWNGSSAVPGGTLNFFFSARATAEISPPTNATFGANSKGSILKLTKFRNASGGNFCRWTGTTSNSSVTGVIECVTNITIGPDIVLPTGAALTPNQIGTQWQRTLIRKPADSLQNYLSFVLGGAVNPACCIGNPFA